MASMAMLNNQRVQYKSVQDVWHNSTAMIPLLGWDFHIVPGRHSSEPKGRARLVSTGVGLEELFQLVGVL